MVPGFREPFKRLHFNTYCVGYRLLFYLTMLKTFLVSAGSGAADPAGQVSFQITDKNASLLFSPVLLFIK
jgi:hypothetical protein